MVTNMLLPRIWRRLSAPAIAALALGLCLSSPAAASAHRRARLESGVSEEAAAGTLQGSTTSGSPAGGETSTPPAGETSTPSSGETSTGSSANTGREERRESRESRRQARRERRQAARADAGCTIELQAPRVATAGAPLEITGTLSCGEGEGTSEETVTLYRKIVGTPGFALLASTSTEAGGVFHFAPSELEGNSVFYACAGAVKSARIRVEAAPAVAITAPAPSTPLLASGRDHAASAATPPAGAVTFTGTVSPTDASTNVALQRELGDDHWQRIATGHVEEDGDFSIVHDFSRPGEVTLRALVRSHGRYMTSASAPVTYRIVRAGSEQATSPTSPPSVYVIDATPAPASVKAGETLTFTGTVAPAHEGQTVNLERESLSGLHGYHVIATATVSSSSSYSIAYAFPTAGVALLRIGAPGDAGIGAGSSEPFKLEVTPAT
jgi:hypothetical protein